MIRLFGDDLLAVIRNLNLNVYCGQPEVVVPSSVMPEVSAYAENERKKYEFISVSIVGNAIFRFFFKVAMYKLQMHFLGFG